MKGIISLIRRTTELHIVVAMCGLLLLIGFIPKLGPAIEDPIQRAAMLGASAHKSDVTIAAIDRRSIVETGPWPWGQDILSGILDQLRLSNAKIVMIEQDAAAVLDAVTIRKFLESDGHRFISFGFEFYPELSDLPADYEKKKEAVERAIEAIALPAQPRDDATLPAMSGVDGETINRGGVSADGFANSFPDKDGIVRREFLAARLGHKVYPALSLATVARATGFTPLITEDASGKTAGVTVGERTIETAPDGSMNLDFAACLAQKNEISAVDVRSGKADPEMLNDRIVVLAVTEPTIAGTEPTPVGTVSDAQIAACAMTQILESKPFTSYAMPPWTVIAIAIAALFYLIVFMRMPIGIRAMFTIATAIVALIVGPALVATMGLQLPAIHFAATLIVLLIASWLWHLFAIEIPAKGRRASFSMRISEPALKAALAEKNAFDPEGRACEIAAVVLDIRSFGSIASSLDPRNLCSFMRRFRNSVARPLIDSGAFIDSWSADECRAAFGALAADPNKAHAACRSAVAILHAISAAREDTAKRYKIERLSVGIGIWFGKAAAGEMGPIGANGFGVTGSAMEAAATLRTLNRTYRTSILVNDEVCSLCERSFRFRPLDMIMPAGSSKPILIHELVGEIGVIMPHLPKYLAARVAYMQGDFERAVHLFAELLQTHPHDGPSQLFLARAKTLVKSPPRAEWLGVWNLA